MQKKSYQTLVYSVVGVIAMAGILIAVNVITGAFRGRVDLTQDKAYTLSAGTKAILRKLDTPIKIRFYCSTTETATPETVYLRDYARRVEDLLAEYKQIAGNKLIIEKLDPQPDSNAEDSARLDGIEGQDLPTGEKFYLGLAVSELDEKQTIPFLDPNRERMLEYDLSRAISRVGTPDRPVVGIMSPLPVFGGPANPMMAQMGRPQQSQPPWEIVTELQNDFTVRQVDMDASNIDDDIKVLLVIHPRDITDKAQYAIDQFIMRGGKLIAFLDPVPLADSQQNQMLGSMPNHGSSLDKLLKAWGLNFDTTKVVADLRFKMRIGSRSGQPQDAPAFLDVTMNGHGINKDDVVTSQLQDVWLPFAGAFTGTPAQGLKETVLLQSTKDSELAEGFMAQMNGANMMQNFKSSDETHALAVRLTGKFKTAFPDGEPTDAKTDAGKTNEPPVGPSLKECKNVNTVILVGDADMLYDQFALRQIPTPFGNFATPMNGNLTFAQNAVEQLTGDNNLIAIRSRATEDRPFTVVQDMQAEAEKTYQSKIKELEDSLNETRQHLSELQQAKQSNQRFILSPEQEAEVAKFRKKEAEVNLQLKDTRKKLRENIDALETKLKWENILGMPVVVCVAGLTLAAYKRKRTSAK